MIAIYCKEIKIKICYSKKEKVDLYILPIKKKDGLYCLQRYDNNKKRFPDIDITI